MGIAWYVARTIRVNTVGTPSQEVGKFEWRSRLAPGNDLGETETPNYEAYVKDYTDMPPHRFTTTLVIKRGAVTTELKIHASYILSVLGFFYSLNDSTAVTRSKLTSGLIAGGYLAGANIPIDKVGRIEIDFYFYPNPNGKGIVLTSYMLYFQLIPVVTNNAGRSTALTVSPLKDFSSPVQSQLHIVWESDQVGSNIGDITCIVEGDYLPDKQYNKKLVGKYSWFRVDCSNKSYFVKHPLLMKVMQGIPAHTYYQKAVELNNTGLPTPEFYINLMSFMAIRFYLGGLVSGKLTTKWLLQSNTERFYKLLARSSFSRFLALFNTTYKGYDRYMSV